MLRKITKVVHGYRKLACGEITIIVNSSCMTVHSTPSNESQAAKITRICGVERLSRWTERSVTQVYRWDYPREKGGAGGIIPSVHHQAILDGARAEGIDLAPADFFDLPEAKAS